MIHSRTLWETAFTLHMYGNTATVSAFLTYWRRSAGHDSTGERLGDALSKQTCIMWYFKYREFRLNDYISRWCWVEETYSALFRFALKWSMTFPGFHCVIRNGLRQTHNQLRECLKKMLDVFHLKKTNFGNSDSSFLLLSLDTNLSLINIITSLWQWLYNTSILLLQISTTWANAQRIS